MANGNPVLMLIGIFTIIWALVLAGTIIIFKFIVPLDIFHSILDGITKGFLTTILVVVWLGLFVAMRNVMVRRQLPPRKAQI
ncbi:MAG: hypothetical protein ACYCPP_06755 [Nitrososphaerales archaeon]